MFHPLAFILLSGLSFDGKIGIGSVINGAVLLIGFAASWYKLQARSETSEKDLAENVLLTRKLGDQVQLLSLTIERLSTISEYHEKRLDHLNKG
jgi:hypothetical protein